jgi:hypothetical protein
MTGRIIALQIFNTTFTYQMIPKIAQMIYGTTKIARNPRILANHQSLWGNKKIEGISNINIHRIAQLLGQHNAAQMV